MDATPVLYALPRRAIAPVPTPRETCSTTAPGATRITSGGGGRRSPPRLAGAAASRVRRRGRAARVDKPRCSAIARRQQRETPRRAVEEVEEIIRQTSRLRSQRLHAGGVEERAATPAACEREDRRVAHCQPRFRCAARSRVAGACGSASRDRCPTSRRGAAVRRPRRASRERSTLHGARAGAEILVRTPHREIDVPIMQRQRHRCRPRGQDRDDDAAPGMGGARDAGESKNCPVKKFHPTPQHQRDLSRAR